jgi:hypothetical protein
MPIVVLSQPIIKERNLLAQKAKEVNLSNILVKDLSWLTHANYQNREFWNNVPAALRSEYIANAEKYLDYDWPIVKATDYLEIVRSGNRKQEVYAAPSNALIALVMGELVEGKGRFLNQIVNATWYYSEQTWWGWSAHLFLQKGPNGLPDINEPTVDLGVGEVASNLAWTWYLFKDEFNKIHPLISKRLKQEIMNKAITPYYERNDFFYMGFRGQRVNNWNPWINYNMLYCVLLLEEDNEQKVAKVNKIINSLDKFLNSYSDDGGCDEGPSYWGVAGGVLYESLDILNKVTNGQFNVFGNPLIQNIGTYFHKVNIQAPYFINFADADATTGGNPAVVYLYGKSIKDNQMQQFGAYLAKLNNWGEKSFSGKICEQIRNLALLPEIQSAEAKEPFVADFWLPDTEVAGARDKEGSHKGFFFGAKGGFNNESHNHNDIGSCVMYFDGKPCLIDLGREQYIASTFGPKRYEIWTMQSKFHNLPVINGSDQLPGNDFKAKNTHFTANKTRAVFTTDISGAYPKSAKVRSWIRTYTLNRGKSFVISDSYELEEVTGACSSNLITYCKVTEVSPGLLRFHGDGFVINMTYNVKTVKPKIAFIEVNDPLLKRYWPNGVTHVVLEFLNPGLKGNLELRFTEAKSI